MTAGTKYTLANAVFAIVRANIKSMQACFFIYGNKYVIYAIKKVICLFLEWYMLW